MTSSPQAASSMTAAQLRRLHALWRAWVRRLRLTPSKDRELRHYYVERFSGGRARETRMLSRADAAGVIAWFERLARPVYRQQDQAAGTAGRSGYPEQRGMRPTAAAWRALWGCAAALGMDREQLDHFILKHYAGANLRGVEDIRTMADLNRVLWGLKAMLRRGPRPARHAAKRAA